jgi:hypothetical protein
MAEINRNRWPTSFRNQWPTSPGIRSDRQAGDGGRSSIRYKSVELAYRTFDKLRQVSQGAIFENKLPLSPSFASSSCVENRSVAADRAAAISVTGAFSKSAEVLYEPSELALGSVKKGCRLEGRCGGSDVSKWHDQ